MKITINLILFVLVFAFSSGLAQTDTEPVGELFPGYTQSAQSATAVTIEKLSVLFDLWQFANIKSDWESVAQLEDDFAKLSRQDIIATHRVLIAYSETTELTDEEMEDDPSMYNNLNIELGLLDLISAKQRLVSSLTVADSFEKKYRTMSDLLNLLRRQLGIRRPHLAVQEKPVLTK